MFRLLRETSLGRRGTIVTPHGEIQTPTFMPVGTAGAMKGITFEDLETLQAQILLCNTYHLHLTPGEKAVQKLGGLHDFIGWQKPIITDSGGFQVFSLEGLRKIEEHGVTFQSHRDGSSHFLGPKEAMRIQHALNSDIRMCFDECPPSTAPRQKQIEAVDRTLRWAAVCKKEHGKLLKIQKSQKMQRKKSSDSSESSASSPLLFGIVQGGLERDLREKCAQELIAIGFDGYAVGGLAVGETPEEMLSILDCVCPILPKDAPRYLMGVGRIDQMEQAVKRGIDMFDCVLPMREGRHGTLYLSAKKKIRILKAEHLKDDSLIDKDSPSPLSRRHSKAYLCHLMRIGERYGETIACMQNLGITLQAITDLRKRIEKTKRK